MGVENSECVIATTWNPEAIQEIKHWVMTLEPEAQQLFAFVPCLVNGKETVFLGPTGSKKGWDVDKYGQGFRKQLISKIRSLQYEDNSGPFSWVEVGYGEFGQKVLQGNNVNCYSVEDYCETYSQSE